MNVNQRYVLHHDGTWMYYVARVGDRPVQATWRGVALFADGQPMTSLRDGWWATDHEAGEITAEIDRADEITGYRLADPDAESARYPAALTVEEFRAQADHDPDLLHSLYEAAREPREPLREVIDGPWLALEGEPPGDDPRDWRADLAHELTQRPEFRHLFPGYLTGFREHMKEALQRRARYVFDRPGGQLEVIVHLPYEPPVTRQVPEIGRNGRELKRKRTVREEASRTLLLHIPDRVPGVNRAAAEAEWDRLEAEFLTAVDSLKVVACGHCRGTGVVVAGGDPA